MVTAEGWRSRFASFQVNTEPISSRRHTVARQSEEFGESCFSAHIARHLGLVRIYSPLEMPCNSELCLDSSSRTYVTRQVGRAILKIKMCEKIPLQYKINLNSYTYKGKR
jgi:hypothetical protein